MVDADERGCWGLRSLTFPAAGDLRGRHCLPGVNSLEGETGLLSIVTKAIGDLQL